VIINRKSRALVACVALFAVGGTSMPVLAQSSGEEARLRKLESEVRAIQRKVFPGGDGRYFEPQITGSPTTGGANTAPSTTAVTDILIRLDALEAQIASLTSQTEENSNALVLLTDRLVAVENGVGTGSVSPATAVAGTDATETVADVTTASAAPTPAVAAPSASRLSAVQAIAKPQTEDAADDEYSYGYRLWNAGFYPEAQQQLTMFVEEHPSHWRATYGRNLLGRAYLDDNKPNEAAPWFLRNYQANKQDARAPDSLLYLAQTMIALNDNNRACIALAEFGDSYPALASGRLSNQYQSNLGKVTCN
jgi:TolA-binding protein